jgi:TetR/AcrR family transcriptional regulator, mexJK operon transcriptional repressor
MEAFLRHANDDGSLEVPQPALAAAHFFCMLKGLRHMRVLVGLSDLPTTEEREAHLVNVVDLFLRAFAPRNGVPRS